MKQWMLLVLLVAVVMVMSACGGTDIAYKDFDECDEYNSANEDVNQWKPIMETEDGYYVVRSSFLEGDSLKIRYYDKATGRCIYLCNKPECEHNGEESCMATDPQLVVLSCTLSGEYLYLSGVKATQEKTECALYRAKIDGTEFTKVGVYRSLKGIAGEWILTGGAREQGLVIHGNKAVIPHIEATSEHAGYFGAKYCTYVMDLNTGKSEELPLHKDRPVVTQAGEEQYFPYKEWLYYTLTSQYGEERFLYRYNLKNEKTEKLSVPTTMSDYAVVEGKIYYTTHETEETPAGMYLYDPEKQENTFVMEMRLDGEPMVNPKLGWDGTYFLVRDSSWSGETNKLPISARRPNHARIMSPDGSVSAEFDFASKNAAVQLNDGKVYLQRECGVEEDEIHPSEVIWQLYEICSCPIEDVLRGELQWSEGIHFVLNYGQESSEEEAND